MKKHTCENTTTGAVFFNMVCVYLYIDVVSLDLRKGPGNWRVPKNTSTSVLRWPLGSLGTSWGNGELALGSLGPMMDQNGCIFTLQGN